MQINQIALNSSVQSSPREMPPKSALENGRTLVFPAASCPEGWDWGIRKAKNGKTTVALSASSAVTAI